VIFSSKPTLGLRFLSTPVTALAGCQDGSCIHHLFLEFDVANQVVRSLVYVIAFEPRQLRYALALCHYESLK